MSRVFGPTMTAASSPAASELASRRQAAAHAVLQRRERAEDAIEEPPHDYAGTATVLTISSTTDAAVAPEKRACGSSARRWAMTGTASSWTCSGDT